MDQHLPEPRCPVNGDPADRLCYVFRGVSMGQLLYKSSGERVQLVWRSQDKLIMRYFLAKHRFEPHMPKSFSMRELARLLDVNVTSLDVAEWLAIEAKMRSSLDYHLKRIMDEHSSEFRSKFDEEKRRKVYVWPKDLRNTLLSSVCEGCKRGSNLGGDYALHVHVQGENHEAEKEGDETARNLQQEPHPELGTSLRPPITPSLTRKVSLASVPEDMSISTRDLRNGIHSQRPPRPSLLGHYCLPQRLPNSRGEVLCSPTASPTLPPLRPVFEEITKRKRALADISIAYISACSELVTTSLTLDDPEARLPLYAIVLWGLLPMGVNLDVSDVMLDLLSDAHGVEGRGAVEQLLAGVQTLGRKRDVIGRHTNRAVERVSEVVRVWADEGHFSNIINPSWLSPI